MYARQFRLSSQPNHTKKKNKNFAKTLHQPRYHSDNKTLKWWRIAFFVKKTSTTLQFSNQINLFC